MKRYVLCNGVIYDTNADRSTPPMYEPTHYSTDGEVLIERRNVCSSPANAVGLAVLLAVYRDEYKVLGRIEREADTIEQMVRVGDYVQISYQDNTCSPLNRVGKDSEAELINCGKNKISAFWVKTADDTLKRVWKADNYNENLEDYYRGR